MGKSTGIEDEFQLWVLLHMTRDAIHKAWGGELKPYGISVAQATILFFIKAIGESGKPVTPAELSRWFFREANSVSGVLIRMEREGLIRRVKDLHKKNLVRVVITPKGEKAYKYSSRRMTFRRVMSCLTASEEQQLWHCLWKLRRVALDGGDAGSSSPFPPPPPEQANRPLAGCRR